MPKGPVDFEFARSPALRVASIAWSGPWNERKIRAQFERVDAWARRAKVRTGRWVFREPGARRWVVGIEVKGAVRGEGPIRVRSFPASAVARVIFDPDAVSPRVVYHGLSDWLRWRKREHEVKSVGTSRELYSGNPWRDPRAWARTEVQVLVRR
jgi:effector-binding domain-containing protein